MIRNVTSTWKSERTRDGLYIVRCTKPGFGDRIRIGAGGNKGGAEGVYRRLHNHGKLWRGRAECETHCLQPFADVVSVWALDGWAPEQIGDGEKCLWRAMAVRFPKHRGTLKDLSVFVLTDAGELEHAIKEVDVDLVRLERVFAASVPVVHVPHTPTAVRRPPLGSVTRAG